MVKLTLHFTGGGQVARRELLVLHDVAEQALADFRLGRVDTFDFRRCGQHLTDTASFLRSAVVGMEVEFDPEG